MADFESKASDLMKELMSDPAMAEKVKDIMGMLGGGGASKKPETNSNSNSGLGGALGALGALSGLGGAGGSGGSSGSGGNGSLGNLGGLDINLATIQKIKKIYDKVMTTDDPRLNLLNALRPYLNSKRLANLDNAMKIVQVTRLTSVMGDIDNI